MDQVLVYTKDPSCSLSRCTVKLMHPRSIPTYLRGTSFSLVISDLAAAIPGGGRCHKGLDNMKVFSWCPKGNNMHPKGQLPHACQNPDKFTIKNRLLYRRGRLAPTRRARYAGNIIVSYKLFRAVEICQRKSKESQLIPTSDVLLPSAAGSMPRTNSTVTTVRRPIGDVRGGSAGSLISKLQSTYLRDVKVVHLGR